MVGPQDGGFGFDQSKKPDGKKDKKNKDAEKN